MILGEMETVALFRLDRMGDLILTLPVDQSPSLENKKIFWFVPKSLTWMVDQADPLREYIGLEHGFSLIRLVNLVRILKDQKVTHSIIFHGPWWLSFACWLAGVKVRGGRLSQWHSFLFFNKGLRQKRSQGKLHETAYNMELVEHVFGKTSPQDLLPSPLRLRAPALDILKAWGLEEKKYVVVHPGMGGSAKNWATRNYNDLINELSQNYTVVVTGTSSDFSYLSPLKRTLSHQKEVRFLDDRLTGPELLEILERAKAVVAPSTGVIHLSASLGTPSIGLYSPRKNERSTRWGPRGDHVEICQAREIKDSTMDSSTKEPLGTITVMEVMEKLKSWI